MFNKTYQHWRIEEHKSAAVGLACVAAGFSRGRNVRNNCNRLDRPDVILAAKKGKLGKGKKEGEGGQSFSSFCLSPSFFSPQFPIAMVSNMSSGRWNPTPVFDSVKATSFAGYTYPQARLQQFQDYQK